MSKSEKVLEKERWAQAYSEHWTRVLAAIPEVDDKLTPRLNAGQQSTIDNLRAMVGRLKENMGVMMHIASQTFVEGKVASFRKQTQEENLGKGKQDLAWAEIEKLEKANHFLGNRILNAVATFSTFDNIYAKKPKKKPKKFELPKCFLEKYDVGDLDLPWNNHLLKLFFRPTVFLVLSVGSTMDVSRLEIQLYTEAAPQVVFDFLQICKNKSFDRIKILRGFAKVWLDCEILLDDQGISIGKIDVDENALANDKQMGILSIPRIYENGFHHGHLNFSISFRPLFIEKGRRIAFGRVVSGFRSLSKLEEFGTVKGGLKKEITCEDCGLIINTEPYFKKCKYLAKQPHLRDS